MKLLNSEALPFILFIGGILFLCIFPFYLAIRKNKKSIQYKWGIEDDWREVEYGGEKFPIRQREMKTWELMNRSERRHYITTLEKYIKTGKLKIELDGMGRRMLIATSKGRKIEFDAIDFYKVKQ